MQLGALDLLPGYSSYHVQEPKDRESPEREVNPASTPKGTQPGLTGLYSLHVFTECLLGSRLC